MNRWHTLVLLVAAVAANAHAQSVTPLLPDQIKWTPLPAAVAPGAQSVFLAGALAQAAPYTLRVHLDKNGIVTPHTHPDTRYVTILSGTVNVGTGDTIGEGSSTRVPSGTFIVIPAGTVHYSWAKDGEATYQESGVGPSSNDFLKK